MFVDKEYCQRQNAYNIPTKARGGLHTSMPPVTGHCHRATLPGFLDIVARVVPDNRDTTSTTIEENSISLSRTCGRSRGDVRVE